MKSLGTGKMYDAYDMDKLLKTLCRGDYNEECSQCGNYRKDWRNGQLPCEKKQTKRNNIQRGCRKLEEICGELGLPGKMLTWDLDEEGDWAGNVKGVDDYLYALDNKGIM
jgi:hypothetical protein